MKNWSARRLLWLTTALLCLLFYCLADSLFVGACFWMVGAFAYVFGVIPVRKDRR